MNTTGISLNGLGSNGSGMRITPLTAGDGESQRTFQQVLSIERRGRTADVSVDKQREAAEQLIAVTFVEPILRQAREVRSSEGPFGITQAEKQFGAMLDAATAKKMVRSWNMPMVDRLARDMRALGKRQEASQ